MKGLNMRKLFVFAVLMMAALSAFGQANFNLQGTVLPSLSRSAATVSSADQVNNQWRGGQFIINVSTFVSGTYTPTIQGKDPVSGNYYTILTGPAIGSTSTTALQVYPGVSVTTTGASALLPRTWRISLAGASTPVMTFSVGFSLAQ